MKVKELIEKLNKFEKEKEVVIRFGLSEEDDVGYALETFETGEYGDNVAIYAEYTATVEDCNFMGQVDLKEAYKNELERSDT